MLSRVEACLGLFLLGPVGCATSSATSPDPIEAEAIVRTTLVYVEGMTWPVGWGSPTSQALEGLDGVNSVEMRFDEREFEVAYDPSFVSLDAIMETIKARGFTPSLTPPATVPPERSRLSDEARAKLDIRTITHGDAVELSEHFVAGKVTIFDYYADWCGPCLLLARDLEQLLVARSDVAVRKIDIVTWKSEAAAQATREFKLKGIPYVRVYGPDGKFLGAVPGNDVAKIMALLPKAADWRS